MLLAIEIFFVGLLVLAGIAIGWVSFIVLKNIYKGQR
jgi:hypothetical protein